MFSTQIAFFLLSTHKEPAVTGVITEGGANRSPGPSLRGRFGFNGVGSTSEEISSPGSTNIVPVTLLGMLHVAIADLMVGEFHARCVYICELNLGKIMKGAAGELKPWLLAFLSKSLATDNGALEEILPGFKFNEIISSRCSRFSATYGSLCWTMLFEPHNYLPILTTFHPRKQ